MDSYQKEQFDALEMVVGHLNRLTTDEQRELRALIQAYMDFRQRVDRYLGRYFSRVCTTSCFQSQRSACCSRDGIITFFADVVVNFLMSRPEEIESLFKVLQAPHEGFKCVYLGPKGCLWRVKPIVCQMFLCDPAMTDVFAHNPDAGAQWEALKKEAQGFKWPDRPVLFDALEKHFLDAGLRSSLMYLHTSPGLLRVKKLAGQ